MTQRSMRDRSNFSGNNKLILGLFGANCSSGRAVTRVPERWSGSWQDNLRLAKKDVCADRADALARPILEQVYDITGMIRSRRG